jgi:hypothetical protein
MNQSRAIVNELNTARGFMKRALLELKMEGRDNFLAVGPDFFTGLAESNGQDQVLRSLGRVWAISKDTDQAVHAHAQEVLESIAANGVDPNLLEDCPICATPSLKTFECLTCGFSFIEDYKCPYLTEDGARVCMKLKKSCNLFGLEFEECETHSGGR